MGICGFWEGTWRYNSGIKQLMNCTLVAVCNAFESCLENFRAT
jgi:hypothetical protein